MLWNEHTELFGLVKEEEFKKYISFRLLGSLAFHLGIDGKIWLMMHPYAVLVVCQSKDNFELYLTLCMDINYLVQSYEFKS